MDDGEQYMDDLFGDDDAEQLPLTGPSRAVKGLPQRLDELASSNCTQQIAWSRFGVIAAVDASNRGVNLYTYMRDGKSRAWVLGKPMPLWPPTASGDRNIVHIEWSDMGNALAAVDTSGRISVFIQGYALNQMALARSYKADPDDDMHAVIGLYWLPVFPQQQKSGIYWSARWDGQDFEYDVSYSTTSGMYNPIESKSAMLCLTRNGRLRLLYEQRDLTWSDIWVDLQDPVASLDFAVTHAAFGPSTDNTVLLATYDYFHYLRVYRIRIDWHVPADIRENASARLSPVLEAVPILFQDSCVPSSLSSSDPSSHNPAEVSHRFQITHLAITPVAAQHQTQDPTLPTVMAVFALLPPASSVQLLDIAQQYQHVSAAICRWQVRPGGSDALSPCFDQLTQKKKPTSSVKPRHVFRLDRLPDTPLHCAVLSTTHLRAGTLLSFITSNGEIQFRSRDTLEALSLDAGLLDVQTEANLPEIRTMTQVGFSFPAIDSPLQVALSPNSCTAVILKETGELELRKMQYTLTPLGELKPDDAKFHSVVVALALQHGTAMLSFKSSDDLLAVLPEDDSDELKLAFVQQCRRSVRLNFDLITEEGSKNIANLQRMQPLYKCLSIQNTLGTNAKGTRNLRSKLAWMTLNMRSACIVLMSTLKPNESLRPEMAISLSGQLRWSVDLIIYIMQELFDLAPKIRGREGDIAFLQDTLRRENNAALFILLSSFTRVMLHMLARQVWHGMIHAQNGVKTAVTHEQRATFGKILQLFYGAPLSINAFQAFHGEADAAVKDAYARAALPDARKTRIENDIVQRAELPPELMPAVTAILTTALAKLMRAAEPGAVHNYDIAWLGLTDDWKSRQTQARFVVDIIRKIRLPKDARLRRCTRCRSVMEDIQPQSSGWQGYAPWVLNSQKSCVCFSSLAVEGVKG